MAKKTSNACVTRGSDKKDGVEQEVIHARCVNARPGKGWVSGTVVGFDGAFIIVRGEMTGFANLHPNLKGLKGEWKCERKTVE